MVIPWDLLITGQDQLIRGDVREGGEAGQPALPPPLSACEFSLHFPPSSKHIATGGTELAYFYGDFTVI